MVKLTEHSILAARQWYADNAQGCIDEVLSGAVKVYIPQEDYFAQCRARASAALAGEYDHTLAFLQRAHYIQTGECLALLP